MNKRIADEILNQIKGTVGTTVLFSWGAHAYKSISENNLQAWGIKNGLGGLLFRVNGHHYKGQIMVVLNAKDLYDVYYCSIRKYKLTLKEKKSDLYVDEFAHVIDNDIEFIEEYNAS